MKHLGMSTLNQAEVEVYDRMEGRTKFVPSGGLEQLVKAAIVDLVGPGALPRPALRSGTRTAGDGEGCAFVRFAWGTVERVSLVVAQRNVRGGTAIYCHQDGTPLSIETAPAVVAEATAPAEPTKKSTGSKLRAALASLTSSVMD